jgi:excinuclease UvrABC nuclease subunit
MTATLNRERRGGELWQRMDARPRRSVASLSEPEIPSDPGVYALYKGSDARYVGKAGCLQDRVWKNHCGKGKVMTGSAFRRNVAEHLGIATAKAIKKREYQPSPEEVRIVREWIECCDVAWITCTSAEEALALETAMKDEWMPPLTKR